MVITKPISINFHLFKSCDARCKFCFGTFRDVDGYLALPKAKQLLLMLRTAGGQKLTFAGGEPTLHPAIGELVCFAKSLGFVTGIVTNGSRLEALIDGYGDHLDWAALSVDSADESTQFSLGRGCGNHVERAIAHADLCRRAGIRLKLNTVVTALNWRENMGSLVRRMAPERWKIFQVLRVVGENDGTVERLLITKDQFQKFVDTHIHLESPGLSVVPENNNAMLDSYVMIDPMGRFYGNTGGVHHLSPPILEVGVTRALSAVGFMPMKFEERGGFYRW